MPMTIEAESAPVTKKTAMRKTASATVTVAAGQSRRVVNSVVSSPWSSRAFMSLPLLSCRSKAAPPRIENHTNDTSEGTATTKSTN